MSTTRLLLRGGLVADGIGTTTQPADILIEGPRIAAIGPRIGSAGDCEVIGLAPGSVVCPGFIDAHVHADGPLLALGRVAGALAQGVTTLVVGQDGESWIGATADTARYLNTYFTPVNGAQEPARDLSVADYRDAVSGRLTQNVVVLASQGTIRHNVAGMSSRPLDDNERSEARWQVETALQEGAAGLSSGLDYLPSRFATIEEIADIAAPLAAAGRPYVSHLRTYGPGVKAGLDELAAVGARAGIRVHASHLWGTPGDIEAAFQASDDLGVALSFDMYPYRKSSTILATLLLPPLLQAQGPEHTLAALADPRERHTLLAGAKFTGEYLAKLYLGCLPDEFAESAGHSITGAALRNHQPAGEWALDLLLRSRLNVGAHLDRPTLADEHLAWLISHDRFCAGSDGIYQGQHPHPRGYGAFARLTQRYCADGTDYQLLARRLAGNAADAYGLAGRGRLGAGLAADICVIAPAGVTDRAIYAAPRIHAAGVDLVIVNGSIVWRDGETVSGSFPGQLVS